MGGGKYSLTNSILIASYSFWSGDESSAIPEIVHRVWFTFMAKYMIHKQSEIETQYTTHT